MGRALKYSEAQVRRPTLIYQVSVSSGGRKLKRSQPNLLLGAFVLTFIRSDESERKYILIVWNTLGIRSQGVFIFKEI